MDLSSQFPGHHPAVFKTAKGTQYLREPGCQLIMRPLVNVSVLQPFLEAFDPELQFRSYVDDCVRNPIPDAAQLVKYAGQCCYAAFGSNRRTNAKAEEYIENIKKEGHGSVFEHPSFSFFIYGLSRSLTHELVRHRVGVGYSQLSQRYVDGKVLRFVEGPEYQDDEILHRKFEVDIDQAAEDYDFRANRLMTKIIAKDPSIEHDKERKRELRKRVNQAARRRLPNETETWMVFTGNVRSLRHIMEMRAAGPAEVEIRRLGIMMHQILLAVEPLLFSDYKVETLPDGTSGLSTSYRKV